MSNIKDTNTKQKSNVIDFQKKKDKKTLADLVRKESFGVNITPSQIYKLRIGASIWFDADDAICAISKHYDEYEILVAPVNKDFIEDKWYYLNVFVWLWIRFFRLKKIGLNPYTSTREYEKIIQKAVGLKAPVKFVRKIPDLPVINVSHLS